MTILTFIAGLVLLVVGAELLVRGASRLAIALGLSPLVIGLTIVAFGTSAPEIAISVGAALNGQTDVAVGNVVGSNIFNILFILGVSALIVPLAVARQLIRQEIPVMIGAAVLLLVLVLDRSLDRLDGALLTLLTGAYLSFLVWQSRRDRPAARTAPQGGTVPRADTVADTGADTGAQTGHARTTHEAVPAPPQRSAARLAVQLLLIAAGLVCLVFGARMLVDAAVLFARALGVSELVIGLTIVAAGTSLPEVAASIAAALRGERDMAIGNVVGSNILNILACLGLASLVAPAPLAIASSVLNFDIWVLLAASFACLPVLLTGREIARWEGAIFVGYYFAYAAYLILAAQQHAALVGYSDIMLSFVIPLTVVTLVALTLRPGAARSTRR
jgi:cation:H+ antiporter